MWPQNARHGLVVCHQHLISELKTTYITAVLARSCITLHCVKLFLVQGGATRNTKQTCLLNDNVQNLSPCSIPKITSNFPGTSTGKCPHNSSSISFYLYNYKFDGAHSNEHTKVQCPLPGVPAISSAFTAEHQVTET